MELAKKYSSRFSVPVLTVLLLLSFSNVNAQRERLIDHNAIGWFVYNGDHKLSEKWELHTEYQWRRIDFVRIWQQSLARVGANFIFSEKVRIGAGYTFFQTFPYGSYPQADLGKSYPEHRLHQDISLEETYGKLALTHRFRLEQRWVSELDETNPSKVDKWPFQNRIRYQIDGSFALKGQTIDDREFYINAFDEIFIGFGKHVGENVFNQNRISLGLGYQVFDGLQIELNYLNQIVQHADNDPISGRPVFEINNGFRLNINHSLDFSRN
ncbi:DUF2490 domain-containing protein [Dyadobacter sp. CY343]|uniref:DUF2490 domain-containing protein n=1 Tax=Dyadobacter sp. CY343 TaxID=2907299 RepID=UPI001F2A921F|nr:DUF2490 domain-containing protein [Dyadobacter sp. CY343]MCE7063490.1 DUF2490 domain-containing protein [Dyadobacter sp. CY343]